jgi:membrane-bound lytic murein transglycosylase D
VAGKTLKVPLRGTTISTSSTPVNPADVPNVHIVRRGDSLWNIARKYGTTVKRIQAMNGLSTTNLSIGQELKIKEATDTATASNTAIDTSSLRAYVVKKGDSAYTIARQNNTSMDRVLQLNNLSKWSTIYPGQTLYLD